MVVAAHRCPADLLGCRQDRLDLVFLLRLETVGGRRGGHERFKAFAVTDGITGAVFNRIRLHDVMNAQYAPIVVGPPGRKHPRLRILPTSKGRFQCSSACRVPLFVILFGLQKFPNWSHESPIAAATFGQLRKGLFEIPPSPPFGG